MLVKGEPGVIYVAGVEGNIVIKQIRPFNIVDMTQTHNILF